MPGMPFLTQADTYQGVQGEGVPAAYGAKGSGGVGWSFFIWLVVIGVVLPVVVLGSLRAGGFQFVFRRR